MTEVSHVLKAHSGEPEKQFGLDGYTGCGDWVLRVVGNSQSFNFVCPAHFCHSRMK